MFFNKKKKSATSVPGSQLDRASAEEILASGLFDAEWYVRKYPEVAKFKEGALEHFCRHGIFEHRDPGPNFDTARYLATLEGDLEVGRAPFAYALSRRGGTPGRPAWLPTDTETFVYLLEKSGLFDERFYLRENHDVVRSRLDPLDHFVRYGVREGRDPGPKFENKHYTAKYADLLEGFEGPIEHYLRIGQVIGLDRRGPGEYQRWIDAFDDLDPTEREQVAAYAEGVDFSRFFCIQVLNEDACSDLDRIVGAFASQIGAVGRLRLLRGRGVRDTVWAALVAQSSDRTAIAFFDDASEATRDLSGGDAVLLCAGATLLRPHACAAFASALASPGVAGAYADHDRLDEAGVRSNPVLKPAMSPDFLRGAAYAGPVVGLRITATNRFALVESLSGGVDLERALSDLLLACDECRVAHLPFVLAHAAPASASADTGYFEPVPRAARGVPDGPPSPPATDLLRVRIVIPTRDRVDLLEECIDSIRLRTDYPSTAYEIVVVDNDSTEAASRAYFARVSGEPGTRVVPAPGPFNFSALCNAGARDAGADILIFLNNDMTVIRPDWVRTLAFHASRPDIGAVGTRLLFPDDTVQHGGVALGVRGVGAHRLIGRDEGEARRLDATREMTVVTGACLALRRTLFEELGGFDLNLKVAFNDVKLCLDAFRAGYRNLYIGEALLYHHESKSRGYDTSPEKVNRNNREAIYVRDRYGHVFQDDPSYSPNLSLQEVGKLAFPPRGVRPWRRGRETRPRVLILSCVHAFGHGVAMVIAEQAAFLNRLGWAVLIGGPETDHDLAYPGCERIVCSDSEAAATLALDMSVDCIVVHTPPFFSITLHLGRRPFVYAFDHGEPPANLFPDAEIRRRIVWEKRVCAPLAKRVFTISRTIRDQQYRSDAIVVRNGNSHLATWSDAWEARRARLRKSLGFEDHFVILNVSRFTESDRYYKGVDQYMEVAREANFYGDRPTKPYLFVHAGRGKLDDVAYVEAGGITVFPNISNAEMAELYAAADLFVSFSKWEGYNLGIGQARAMGLPVVASDIEAHREFGIETSNEIPVILKLLNQYHRRWVEGDLARSPVVEPWETPLRLLSEVIEADFEQAGPAPWFRFARAAG